MTKTTIKNLLKRAADGAEFITKGDIKRALGCGNDCAAEITEGLDYVKFGRMRRYDVDEVAQKIYQSVVRVAL